MEAKVASIEALEEFRAALMRYRQRATTALDDVASEMKQMREWLAYERRMELEGGVRRLTRKLEQAKGELMTAKMSSLHDDVSAQQMAVRKAKRELEEAEAKLAATRKWARDFDGIVAPAQRPLDSLRDRIAVDLPKAVGSLDAMIRALEAYAEREGKPRPAGEPEKGGEA